MMNRSRSLFLSISLAVMLPVATGVLWSATNSSEDDAADSLYKHLAMFSEVFGLVRNSYVDPTDPDALLEGALDGVGDALDPFSALVPAGALADYERGQALARARSGLVVVKDHGIAFVLHVDEGSPGATAGIERGDVVAEAGAVDTRKEPIWRLQRQLAGDPGEKLQLRVVRNGEPIEKTLLLAATVTPPPRREDQRGIAVLHLSRVEPGDATLVRKLLTELAASGAKKLLVDLQGVGGGDGEEAFAVAALFAQGDLGGLDGRGTRLRDFRSDSVPLWQGEIAVTIDGGTYGAAEIVATVLKARAGAKLVGLKSFGWAGERSFFDLAGGTKLHLTTAFYAGPDGAAITGGLIPDVSIEDFARGFGEAERPLDEVIRERALELLAGKSAGAETAA